MTDYTLDSMYKLLLQRQSCLTIIIFKIGGNKHQLQLM